MKSMLVIGVGRFGKHLALKLTELGNEVLVIDRDEDAVGKLAPLVTGAKIGDCMEPDVVKSLGVGNFDCCFVCISQDFQSSLEITNTLKEMGARYVVSKADRDIHAKFLLKVGADEIIYPERDMAQRAAMRYSAKNAFDYIELAPDYAIMEMRAPDSWAGRTVVDVDVRNKFGVNIIGLKIDGKVEPVTSAQHRFSLDEHLLVAGAKRDIIRLMDKK